MRARMPVKVLTPNERLILQIGSILPICVSNIDENGIQVKLYTDRPRPRVKALNTTSSSKPPLRKRLITDSRFVRRIAPSATAGNNNNDDEENEDYDDDYYDDDMDSDDEDKSEPTIPTKEDLEDFLRRHENLNLDDENINDEEVDNPFKMTETPEELQEHAMGLEQDLVYAVRFKKYFNIAHVNVCYLQIIVIAYFSIFLFQFNEIRKGNDLYISREALRQSEVLSVLKSEGKY